MRLRMSAASCSSRPAGAESAALLWPESEVEEESAKHKIRARKHRGVMGGILPERCAQDNCQQKKRAQANRPEPYLSRSNFTGVRTRVAPRQPPLPSP